MRAGLAAGCESLYRRTQAAGRWTADERKIVAARSDGIVRVFAVENAEKPVDDLVRLAQLLSSHQLDPASALVPLASSCLSGRFSNTQELVVRRPDERLSLRSAETTR